TTSYGNGFLNAFNEQADAHGVKISGVERYGPQDLGVTAQIVRLMASNPDAIYILSFGTPAFLPQAELAKRGYKGKIYQPHGVANADCLRVGGKDVEGTYLSVAPFWLPNNCPMTTPPNVQAWNTSASTRAPTGRARARYSDQPPGQP